MSPDSEEAGKLKLWGGRFDQSLAKGFVQLWGLPSKIAAKRDLKG